MQRIEEVNWEHRLLRQFKTPVITRVMIYIYLLISFYEPFLNGTIGSVTKYYMFALMGVAIVAAHNVKIRKHHIFFFFWLAYQIFTLFWTSSYDIAKLHFLSQVGMVALLFTLTAIPICDKTISGIINTLWLGSASVGFLSLFFSQPYHGKFEQRLVLTLFGAEAEPNNQAAFVVVGVAVSFYYIIVEKRYIIPSILIVVINTYSLFLTGSRGGLVSLIVIVLCFVFFNGKIVPLRKNLMKIFLIVIFVVTVYFVTTHYLDKDIFERLFNFEDYEGGSERAALWSNAWELFSTSVYPVFGAGWGAYYGYKGYYSDVHNTYLAMLCDVGIIGFMAFFTPIAYASVSLLKRRDILPIALLIAGFMPAFFIGSINKRYFWNAIIFLFIIYNYVKENERARKNTKPTNNRKDDE